MSDNHRNDRPEDALDPEGLLRHHRDSGEPLGGHELDAILAAHLATRDAFDMRGSDLWWESAIFPDPDTDDAPDSVLGQAEAFVRTLTHEDLLALTETCLAILGVDVTVLADLLPDPDAEG